VEHVFTALRRAPGEIEVGQVSLEELDVRNVIDIALLAGDEGVGDADPMPAANELGRQVGSDEPRAAGDEIMSHA
jgi:hypothetical protein